MGGRAWHRRHLMEAHGFALPDGTWQQLPSLPTEVFLWKPVEGEVPPRFECTEICVANVDTLTAALVLGDACALNFANACTPGGRYRSGGRAQEEDLCRLLPQLYDSLKCAEYPIAPHTALLTRDLLAVRCPGTYERRESVGACTIISAAMPCGIADRRPAGGWAKSPWARTLTERIRAVLCAAQTSGHPHLVLGAFGCGAFGNPAGPVAAVFREELASPCFRGAFARVVFAVLDPMGTGNLGPFHREIGLIERRSGHWSPGPTRERDDVAQTCDADEAEVTPLTDRDMFSSSLVSANACSAHTHFFARFPTRASLMFALSVFHVGRMSGTFTRSFREDPVGWRGALVVLGCAHSGMLSKLSGETHELLSQVVLVPAGGSLQTWLSLCAIACSDSCLSRAKYRGLTGV